MLGSRNTNTVATPKWLYDALNAVHKFDFDPCPLNYTEDGLAMEWGSCNFVNPPYDSIRKWLEKAIHERDFWQRKSVFLIPFRPSRKYWFDLCYPRASQIMLLEGGVKFEGYSQNAPMPLAVVIFDPKSEPCNEGRFSVMYDEHLKRRIVNLTAK